jgi:bifunctional UDP-N-acetylglucosamine pyrophosphorylase/glucosamine-1-phosphate N-acetyltransferase
MKTKAIILAAGQGTRMKSDIPKVLHKTLGKSLVQYSIDAAKKAGVEEVCLVVGHRAEVVKETLGDTVSYALQKEQLGTGHAVMQGSYFIEDAKEVFILSGDTPLITGDTLSKMLAFHKKNQNAVTVLSAKVEDATGYGRIVRDGTGAFCRIVEQKDATEDEKCIQEINGGMYIFEGVLLKKALKSLTNNNAQNEYYLTDTLEILLKEGYKVEAMMSEQVEDILGVNSKVQLAEATAILQKRVNTMHMENGVILMDPNNTYIEETVQIGQDTVVEPGCMLQGNTSIGAHCQIGHHTKIKDSRIGQGTTIENSIILSSEIGEKAIIGPFAYIRPNSKLANGVKIGDFVEIKNATIGEGTKVPHLTYVGDADVGKKVNFGCGSILVNYDGENKFRSTIKDGAFIGCNTSLVSPVTVEEGAYTAAGSTITKDVPKDSLAIARAKQENKENWVSRKHSKNK